MPINPLSSSDQEADKKENKYSLISGTPTTISGAQGQTAQGGGGSPTSSGSFTNLQSYLDVNADQSEGLGAKIEQNVQNTANEGRTNLSQAGKEFNNQVEQAGINRDQVTAQALGNIAKNAYNNPSALEDNDVATFSDVRNKGQAFAEDADTGPKSLNDLSTYQAAKTKLDQASDKANLTGSEAGRETLLRESFSRPSYTKGQSSLDQLFTQNAPQNRNRFEKLRSGLLGDTGLVSEENQAIQAANERRAQEKQEVAGAYQDVNDLLYNPNAKQEMMDVRQYVDPRLTPQYAQQPEGGMAIPPQVDEQGRKYFDAQVNKYGLLSREEQNALALQDQLKAIQAQNLQAATGKAAHTGDSQYTFGADLTPAVQKASGFDPTLANSLTDDQFARIQALNKLAGRDAGTIGDTNLGNLANEKFDPTVNYNSDIANGLIKEKANQFKADMGNALLQANTVYTPNYRFGAMPLPDQAKDIQNRIMDGELQPVADQPEAQKVIDEYIKQAENVNTLRAKYGLPPLDYNNFYDNGSLKSATEKVAREFFTNLYGHWETGMDPGYALPSTRETAIDTVVNHPETRGTRGVSPEVAQNLRQVAQIRALQNLMAMNKKQMLNPTAKYGEGQPENNKPGMVFFD